MSDLTEAAAVTLTHLQDYTRDLEADLGKAARNRTNNPSFGPGQYVPDTSRIDDFTQQNHNTTAQVLRAYKAGASAALSRYNGLFLTGPEKTEVEKIRALIKDIDLVESHADATALVATFNN
jgi:hypothetical protein